VKRILYRAGFAFLFVGCSCEVSGTPRAVCPGGQHMKASAIQVLMIQSDEIKLPADFPDFALRESDPAASEQAGSSTCYRDGDHMLPRHGLVVLHRHGSGVQKGSEMARNLTTVTERPRLTFIASYRTRTERPSWSGI